MRKKAMILALSALFMLLLSSCDFSIGLANSDARAMINERANLNIACLDDLKEAGLITDDTYNTMKESINSQLDAVKEAITVDTSAKKDDGTPDNAKIKSNMQKALSKLSCFTEAYWAAGYDETTKVSGCSSYSSSDVHDIMDVNNPPIAALDLMHGGSATGAASMQAEMNYPVYVINKDEIDKLNAAGADSIQAVVDAVKAAQESNDYNGVKKYFTDSGYTLFGNVDPYGDGGLFCKTTSVTYNSSYKSGVNVMGKNLVLPTSADYRNDHYITMTPGEIDPVTGKQGDPTYDLPCACLWNAHHPGESYNSGGSRPCEESADYYWFLQLQLIEFNPETVKTITGANGSGQNRYVIVRDGTTKPYALLMEYPVDTIRNIKYDKNDGSWKLELDNTAAQEGSYVYNLLTGAVRSRVSSTDFSSSLINWGSANQPLMSSKSFQISSDASMDTGYMDAQFIKDPAVTGVGACHILLKDYLELTYMPNVIADENLIALGRRVRITHTSGSMLSDPVGIYIDKNGDPLAPSGGATGAGTLSTIEIAAADLIDVVAMNDSSTVKTLGDPDATSSSNVAITGATGTASLAHEVAETIGITARFWKNQTIGTHPSVNSIDSVKQTNLTAGGSEVAPPPMYGIAINLDPFNTGLYSGWIAASDAGTGSLDWWLGFLQAAQFKYTIDKTALEQALMGDYSTSLRANGIIILDLDTIANIQADYQKQDNETSVSGFRTIFALLGIVLGAYGILLLACWAIDINMVGGPKLLTLFSFGQWVAIANNEDMPEMSTDGKHYMSFGNTLKAAIGLMAIGVILSTIDVVGLVNAVVQAVGSIAEFFSSSLFGK